jgi:hypothetical protein
MASPRRARNRTARSLPSTMSGAVADPSS